MKTLVVISLILLHFSSVAQSEQQLVAQAERYEAAMNENASYETYKQVLKINPNHYQSLWKLSELCSRIGNRQPTTRQKQAFFIAGRNYAQAAIRVNPAGADGYYALAVAMGRFALSGSGKERIDAVKEIRSNAEKALRFNPNHGRAWHVLGKWHYEVSNLNMFEKAGVNLVYGGLPSSSIEESIKAYEKAKQLEPYFALNFLELAKAYKRNGQKAQAIALLKQLSTLPAKTADDTRIKKEGATLLKNI